MFSNTNKSLQQLTFSNMSVLILIIASKSSVSILCLGFVFTDVPKKKILSTTALLTEVTRQVRAYSAKSLKRDAAESIPKIF